MLKHLFSFLIFLFTIQSAQAAAMPESFKVLGRGIHDKDNALVLQLACTGGWDENNPETWLSEPTCDEARFVLFTGAGDPHWIGKPIRASDTAGLMKSLKFELAGEGDYSSRVLNDIRPNQLWQKSRAMGTHMYGPMATVGAGFMTAAIVVLALVSAPGIVTITLGPVIGWNIFFVMMDSGFGSAYAFKKAVNGSTYSDVAHTVSLHELKNKDPRNWSVRPVALKSEGFRFVLNAVTSDDAVLAENLPAKICRFSSVDVTYEGNESELEFFFSMGAWPKNQGAYDWRFYDRAKNGPGCSPGLAKRKICEHNVTFQSKTFFDQALRSSWLKVPAAPVAALKISRINPRKLKAILSLEGSADSPVISATGHDPIELMHALSKRIRNACSISARATP